MRDAWARPIHAAFHTTEPRTDVPEVKPLPYRPGQINPDARKLRPGDVPTAAMAVKQAMQLAAHRVSELGEATLAAAAVLPGLNPEDRSQAATASQVRSWLSKHFVRNGAVAVPSVGNSP